MNLTTVGARLNKYFSANKYLKLALRAAPLLFLLPVLLHLTNIIVNVVYLLNNEYLLDPESIFNALDRVQNSFALWSDLADINKLIFLFGATLTFARGEYKLLGWGFGLVSLACLVLPLPYWLHGLFGGSVLTTTIACCIYIFAFACLSVLCFRLAKAQQTVIPESDETMAEPLPKHTDSVMAKILVRSGKLAAAIIIGISCLLFFCATFAIAPRRVPAYTPNTELAADCNVSIPENLRAYCCEYVSSSGVNISTCVEPDPEGGYIIKREQSKLMSSLVSHISYEQYLELIQLFYDYNILSSDADVGRSSLVRGMRLSFFSADEDETVYTFEATKSSSDFADTAPGELYWALEEKYESFGPWSFS